MSKIIAVDFDGTLCKSEYPEIGPARYDLILKLIMHQVTGAKLILWTCRTGKQLEEAVEWCKEYGLHFDAINENLPEMIEMYGTDPRKIGADIYVDDKAVKV